MRLSIYICGLFIVGVCYADRVGLVNGGSFDGLIIKESSDSVVLDLGTGSMKLDRKYIDSINYSDNAEREEIKRGWQKKHFLNKKFVPAGYEDLVVAYKKLLLQRGVAMRASGAAKSAKFKEVAYQKELDVLKSKYAAASGKLRGVDKETDMLGYNALVRQVNSLSAAISVKIAQLQKNSDRLSAATAISSYLSELDGFEEMLQKRKRLLPADADDGVRFLYEGLSAKVAELNKEFSKEVIATKRRGRSTLVTAVMNDKVSGTFVLDTGAELVSITEAFAGRLGLHIDSLPAVDITVADGRRVKGWAVVLKSVRLGGAYSENVSAVILPGKERPGHDGLLGMSFLHDYIVRLDGASGKVVLRRL